MKYSLLIISFFLISGCAPTSERYNLGDGYVAYGFDVVSYFEGKPVKGLDDFIVEYDGVSLKFATEAHAQTFERNPGQFLPQYGGFCAYAIAEGERVDIDPETYQILDGKLYLFYNAWGTNTLELWSREGPEILRDRADRNWSEMIK
ncbi:YHS domain-containing (seleno)protein [Robertkochia solimangrovi]|uniref:YHS domain-containing (seleno)protein n=1 Tax=Robertkochia solimangrovi TaxID=2213046 RepID=UPI001F54B432|nr:YHS domain-containing (seleno)protein [Robertkochia solimangrovi]